MENMIMDIPGTGPANEKTRPLKHLGTLALDNAPVIILFRTVPKEPKNCLVVGANFLNSTYRDALMRVIKSDSGQSAWELGEHISTQKFPDGMNMLAILHEENYIKKLPTTDIMVTFGSSRDGRIPLDQLNQMLADEKGISIEELSTKQQTTSIVKSKRKNVKKTTKV
jgi:hypothetical protein